MLQAVRRVAQLETIQQFCAETALARAERIGIPFRPVTIVNRHKGRLTAHGESDIVGRQLRVDAITEGFDGTPLRVGIGQCHARCFEHPRDFHQMFELDLAFVAGAGDRRGVAGVGRGGQRNVPFASEQAGSRVEADPAGARQINLAPGVQVGEIDLGAARTVERFDVRGQLDQITGDEAGRHAEMAQQLHQKPGRIAA